jgi:tellurite methyltransferase
MLTNVKYFDQQFSVQVREGKHELNPFELMARPFLSGAVLDFGCGLGNLSIAAAESDCSVFALDASPTAVAHLREAASHRSLPIVASQADVRTYRIDGSYDSVVSIGLLMFLDAPTAQAQLGQLMSCVRPGGVIAVNVLIEGTDFLDMFGTDPYYLFRHDELRDAFDGWGILAESYDDFDAPHSTLKRFATVIARRPYTLDQQPESAG